MKFHLIVDNNQTIILQMINNGAPIKDPQEVFKLYFSTKTGKENMGLGLPIAKKIVMDHGGEMSCLNLTEGAGFEISLPLRRDI
jgi:nitrogen fixation/metabolism regulation signal transduction histidine kinase